MGDPTPFRTEVREHLLANWGDVTSENVDELIDRWLAQARLAAMRQGMGRSTEAVAQAIIIKAFPEVEDDE
jgi:hypothetical protein